MDSYINANGGVAGARKNLADVRVHLQQYYCHTSLGSKIQVDFGSDVTHVQGDIPLVADPIGLIALKGITQQIIRKSQADLVTYLVHDPSGNAGILGIAWLGMVCRTEGQAQELKSSINEYIPNVPIFAWVSESVWVTSPQKN